MVPAIVICSLLASHTLLSLSIVVRLGAIRLEPDIGTIGATVVSDILSLIEFAICVSTYTIGFSATVLAVQIIEIGIFVPLILIVPSRAGTYVLNRAKGSEELYFVIMLGIMAIAGALADVINSPGIVGACLAGLSVNTAVQPHPAKAKLEFFGRELFIQVFLVTGLLIAPVAFAASFAGNFLLVMNIVVTLWLGKGNCGMARGRRVRVL